MDHRSLSNKCLCTNSCEVYCGLCILLGPTSSRYRGKCHFVHIMHNHTAVLNIWTGVFLTVSRMHMSLTCETYMSNKYVWVYRLRGEVVFLINDGFSEQHSILALSGWLPGISCRFPRNIHNNHTMGLFSQSSDAGVATVRMQSYT